MVGLSFLFRKHKQLFPPHFLWGLLFILYWKKPIVRSFCILYWFCDRVPKKGGLPIPRESHLAIRRLSIMLARWCTQKATCMMAANQCNATEPFTESHKWQLGCEIWVKIELRLALSSFRANISLLIQIVVRSTLPTPNYVFKAVWIYVHSWRALEYVYKWRYSFNHTFAL